MPGENQAYGKPNRWKIIEILRENLKERKLSRGATDREKWINQLANRLLRKPMGGKIKRKKKRRIKRKNVKKNDLKL